MQSFIDSYDFVWWHLPLWVAAYGFLWMFFSWLGADVRHSR